MRCLLACFAALCLGLAACNNPESKVTPTEVAAALVPAPPKPKPSARFTRPEHVRGIYLTAWSAGSTRKMDNTLALLERTELNSLVIDIRDAGFVYFDAGVPLVKEIGALHKAVLNPEKLMDRLAEAKVYPIARVACFRDQFMAKKHPERCVQTPEGKPWKDTGGYHWLDPYNKANWEYIGDVVEYAANLGFPEIQLDYVRYPSEGTARPMVYPSKSKYSDPSASPTQVVSAFATYIRGRLKDSGAVLSADVFGIVSSGPSDQGIGQGLEAVAEPFDLLCPMVYPSHYAKGEYGIKNPNAAPYEIVSKSLADFAKRLPDKKIRPWLQDFSLGIKYGKAEIRAQIKAAKELGYHEYLLWNPKNRYTEEAVVDNSNLVPVARSAEPKKGG